ncbi:MAG TPA: RNA polymerase sigma factor [Actinomycetota bacterium]|nr:RNA polymerase sigma factor [Actinomycetota bacterium]
MTPRFDFQDEWPEISRHIQALLIRCRVPEALREDLLQETALRILHLQDAIDPDRSVRALSSTIALNLLRDHIRREKRLVPVFDLTLVAELQDVESEVIARDEWRRVSAAIARLKPAQRVALLATAGLTAPPAGHSASAIRVLRMRARQQLRSILDAMSRAKDVSVLSAQEFWKAFAFSRTAAGWQLPGGEQLAQVGAAIAIVIGASLFVEPPNLSTPEISRRSRPYMSTTWPALQSAHQIPWNLAERAALPSLKNAPSKGREAAEKVQHRLSLGRFGHIGGDDDEALGIVAKNVNHLQKRLKKPVKLDLR